MHAQTYGRSLKRVCQLFILIEVFINICLEQYGKDLGLVQIQVADVRDGVWLHLFFTIFQAAIVRRSHG